jgi:Ca-activated chloride channel family protein
MIEFHWPWAFLLLPLPLLALRWLPPQRQFPNALRVPFYQRLRAAESQPSKRRRQRVPTIPLLIWLLLLFALSQPLWLGNDRPRPISGRDLMLLIDVSGSMRRMDFTLDGKAADRLSVVKRVAARFTHGRRGDRLGLILFGDKAYLRASPSHDHQAVIELIDEAEIALAGESTAIGDALGLHYRRRRPGRPRAQSLRSLEQRSRRTIRAGSAAGHGRNHRRPFLSRAGQRRAATGLRPT